jgi:hypothetical protein
VNIIRWFVGLFWGREVMQIKKYPRKINDRINAAEFNYLVHGIDPDSEFECIYKDLIEEVKPL